MSGGHIYSVVLRDIIVLACYLRLLATLGVGVFSEPIYGGWSPRPMRAAASWSD